jgi:hypothetical protein
MPDGTRMPGATHQEGTHEDADVLSSAISAVCASFIVWAISFVCASDPFSSTMSAIITAIS